MLYDRERTTGDGAGREDRASNDTVVVRWLGAMGRGENKKYIYRGDGYKCVSFARCFRNYIILCSMRLEENHSYNVLYYYYNVVGRGTITIRKHIQ